MCCYTTLNAAEQAELRTGWAEAELDLLSGSGGGDSSLVRARHDSDDDASPPRCCWPLSDPCTCKCPVLLSVADRRDWVK